jgi:hypothetical protein
MRHLPEQKCGGKCASLTAVGAVFEVETGLLGSVSDYRKVLVY